MFFPYALIEITTYCNASCLYCPSKNLKRKREFMDFELFKKIVDDLLLNHDTPLIVFHILGEALLHQKLFEMADYIRSTARNPVNLQLTTNGLLLQSDTIRDRVLNSGIHRIRISVRALNETEYGLKFSDHSPTMTYPDYMNAIVSFVRKVHEKKSDILVSLCYFHTVYSPFKLVFPYPFIDKITQVKRLVKNWHTVIEEYKQTIPLKQIKMIKSLRSISKEERAIRLSENLELRIEPIGLWQNQLISDDYFLKESATGKCQLSQGLNINVKGEMIGCCADYDCNLIFGTLRESSIETILNSQNYRKFRANMDEGKLIMPICRKCMGTISRKSTGRAVKLSPPKLLLYLMLLKENPGLFLKKLKERFRRA
ncbi:MAG: radical SAM/SPASM domain-containing protein [Candidatus Omnitrophota bacterium]